MRTATVTITEQLTGFVGDRPALKPSLALPPSPKGWFRTARQRLAAFVAPIPVAIGRRSGTDSAAKVLPGDHERIMSGQVEYSGRPCIDVSCHQWPEHRLDGLSVRSRLRHFVWLLTDGVDGSCRGCTRFVVDEQDSEALAEVAFIVGDHYQGRGIGNLLMDALVVTAHVSGVRRFCRAGLVGQRAVQAILDRFGAGGPG